MVRQKAYVKKTVDASFPAWIVDMGFLLLRTAGCDPLYVCGYDTKAVSIMAITNVPTLLVALYAER